MTPRAPPPATMQLAVVAAVVMMTAAPALAWAPLRPKLNTVKRQVDSPRPGERLLGEEGVEEEEEEEHREGG